MYMGMIRNTPVVGDRKRIVSAGAGNKKGAECSPYLEDSKIIPRGFTVPRLIMVATSFGWRAKMARVVREERCGMAMIYPGSAIPILEEGG